MIQKFRWRFIAISIFSLFLVLTISIGSLIAVNFKRAGDEANRVLTVLITNNGVMTPNNARGEFKQQNFLDQSIGAHHFNPEQIYQYRYFSVVSDQSRLTLVNNQKPYKVSSKEINQVAKKVLAQKENDGEVVISNNDYLFRKGINDQGQEIVAFLNVTLIFQQARSLLKLAMILGLMALIFFAIILIIVSKHAIRPIVKVYNKQKQFITNAGHELKTPLAIISANTEMQEMMGNESEWTESTKEQVARLTELVNRLISLARMEETGDLALSKVDFSKIVQDSSKSFAPVIKSKGFNYQINIQEGLFIKAEAKSLAEIVNILLDNAQKYCDPEGLIAVKLSAGKLNRTAVLRVSNTYREGKNQDYRNFFERFYREDESHNNATEGFGIGLSMAKQVVNAFKGKINVTYNQDRISFNVVFQLSK
ncbi:sensor histidine kinase [Lactobacillus gigeriorum]|uniref:histidine kinase n=1 Tax=Lactobacillus gigeriorum DSM 23908 = CRBIP 24.85 TaxID=1423751 RepID=I7JZA5_9LACO|nr:HAMP domain-containing sensor histidine kinase [Lactobacillus gigeriorum]KRN14125.1 histidine protein kinase [Lactobacillus gigeriorum DSM 23908 = CRBIP 24.85]CCI86140.1 Histidine protein kinase [Lactobacillus gigeriorum DSM 23908 = CRBIP 24.85]